MSRSATILDGLHMLDVIYVVYNRCISSIASLIPLCESTAVANIVVCDNSTNKQIKQINQDYQVDKLIHVSMHGNEGLSRAYNEAIKHTSSKYVMILDDDTSIPNGYVDTVQSYIVEHPEADVFLPIVKSSKIIMSPCKKGHLRFSAIPSIDRMPQKISAINSGMIVKSSLYQFIKYRESLFLDMVDHAFMDDARSVGAKLQVMPDAVLSQDYSRETDDYDSAARRYKISEADNRTYYSDKKFGKLYCEFQLLYWKIKSCIHFGTLKALYW